MKAHSPSQALAGYLCFVCGDQADMPEVVTLDMNDGPLCVLHRQAQQEHEARSLVRPTWPQPSTWDERPAPRSTAEAFQRAAASLHEELEHTISAARETWEFRAAAQRQHERRVLAMVSRYHRAVECGRTEPTEDFKKMQEIAG